MRFNFRYFLFALTLFITEVAIAIYMDDAFIRPFFGDLLVVILVYCAIKTWFNTPVIKTALGVFVFACLIEVSQYFQLVMLLGWGRSPLAATVLGTFFSFTDILMYALGTLTIIMAEKCVKRYTHNKN